jgi:hypothetical protein
MIAEPTTTCGPRANKSRARTSRNEIEMEGNNMAATTLTQETQAEEITQDSAPHFFGDVKTVVARYTHCALCGSNLHFNHITDFAKNMTQEIARCPECGVKARQVMHKLQ